jgi:hypothetical protein
MKKIIFAIILLFPILCRAQAHLGSTLSEINANYPEKVFKIGYTNEGKKYATVEMAFGTFAYYFDNQTGLSDFCIQIPDNLNALNAQVEIYNKKYVIVSDKSWKAYLEGGGVMKINLIFDEEFKNYVFTYSGLK